MNSNYNNPFSEYGYEQETALETIQRQKENMGYVDDTEIEYGKGLAGKNQYEAIGFDSFDETKTYEKGDITVYNNKLYTFKTSHSGAWESSDTETVNINNLVDSDYAPSSTHAKGDFYVWKDGEYSYLTNEEFMSFWMGGNLSANGTVEQGKYTPVGIVAMNENQRYDGKVTIASYYVTDSTFAVKFGNLPTLLPKTGWAYSYDGFGNTMTLINDMDTSYDVIYPAAYEAYSFHSFPGDTIQWYLPSVGECSECLSTLCFGMYTANYNLWTSSRVNESYYDENYLYCIKTDPAYTSPIYVTDVNHFMHVLPFALVEP